MLLTLFSGERYLVAQIRQDVFRRLRPGPFTRGMSRADIGPIDRLQPSQRSELNALLLSGWSRDDPFSPPSLLPEDRGELITELLEWDPLDDSVSGGGEEILNHIEPGCPGDSEAQCVFVRR